MHKFFYELNSLIVNGELTISGIGDLEDFDSRLHPLLWKILLNYLPKDTTDWNQHLLDKRNIYKDYVNTYIIENSYKQDPDPLSQNSGYSKFLEDNLVLAQINKDCLRIFPDFNFYREHTDYPFKLIYPNSTYSYSALRKRVKNYDIDSTVDLNNEICGSLILKEISKKKQTSTYDEENEYQWEIIQRILFIYYKKTNFRYYQEMCEIIAMIYFVFYQEVDETWKMHVECDTYFCFENLMEEISINFEKNFTPTYGIGAKMMSIPIIVEFFDKELYQNIKVKDLRMEYFGYRWISLMLAQEFHFESTIRIWNQLFIDRNRFDLLLFICSAMLLMDREKLLELDFAQSIVRLQHYETKNIDDLLKFAKRLYQEKDAIFRYQTDPNSLEILRSAFNSFH